MDGARGIPPSESHSRLTPGDERVLDELMEAGFDPGTIGSMQPGARERASRAVHLLDLLNDYPTDDADDSLVHATLARVDRAEEERAARLAFDAHEPPVPSRRFRLPDFISVAAIILIAAGVLWPTLTYMNRRAIDNQCSNQLRHVGYAFGNYRADFGDSMPMAVAGFGPTWSSDSANVIHLAPLVKHGYCDQDHLHCPAGHDHEDTSYSYQWQTPGRRTAWSAARPTLVLGDRNPLIDAYRAHRFTNAFAGSLNHGGRGQNVLSSDGATLWLKRPVIGSNDNIWLPAGWIQLTEGQDPGAGDVFLAH